MQNVIKVSHLGMKVIIRNTNLVSSSPNSTQCSKLLQQIVISATQPLLIKHIATENCNIWRL